MNTLNAVRRNLGRGVMLAFAVLSLGCGTALNDIADEINATRSSEPFRIAPDELIEVSFFDKVEYNHTTRVRPDGKATFLGIAGEVEVAGKTVPELVNTLKVLYRELVGTNVTIGIADPGDALEWARSVVVIGEVTNPGPIDMRGGPLTLLEAIGRAGGWLKESAALYNTLLVRRLGDGRRIAWRVDVDTDQWGGKEVYLQPHDVVYVPNTVIDKANIWVDKWIRQMIPIPVGFALIPNE